MKYWYLNMDIKSGFDPGQENYLEKGMATQSSILSWRIPWTEGLRRL